MSDKLILTKENTAEYLEQFWGKATALAGAIMDRSKRAHYVDNQLAFKSMVSEAAVEFEKMGRANVFWLSAEAQIEAHGYNLANPMMAAAIVMEDKGTKVPKAFMEKVSDLVRKGLDLNAARKILREVNNRRYEM